MAVIIFFTILGVQIFIGSNFVRYVYKRLHPLPPKSALWQAAGFGLLASIAAVIVEGWFIPDSYTKGHLSHFADLHYSLLVGVIEETLKAVPLALLVYSKPYFRSSTDGLLLFGISGFVFGIIEDLGYTGAFGLSAGIFRIISGAPGHVAFTAITGYGIAEGKEFHKPWRIILLYPLAAIVLHALWDYHLTDTSYGGLLIILFMTVLVNLGIFQLFRVARREDEQLIVEEVLTGAICPHCRFHNIPGSHVCASCGQPLQHAASDGPLVIQNASVINGATSYTVVGNTDKSSPMKPFQPTSNRNYLRTFNISILFGWLGVDRFYLGKLWTGILKLVTVGGAGIWYITDLSLLLLGVAKDKQHRVLAEREQGLKASLVSTFLVICATSALIILF